MEQASDFTAASFPINLGNWWRYQRTDALTNEVDTIEFRVLSGALVGTEKKYDCVFTKNGNIIDSVVITSGSNALLFESSNYETSVFSNFSMHFPFHVGDDWQGIYYDSVVVDSYNPSLSILGKTYPCFTLKTKDIGPNYFNNRTFAISKNIGIVDFDAVIFNTAPFVQQHLSLIDFHLE